jgi:predicted regulator of Ras-like GTPase activity (Roadblock/LC7/MglB family)
MPVTLGQRIMRELRKKPLTIKQLYDILGKSEPIIRTTINRLKEKNFIRETGKFIDKYKIYQIADKTVNSLALKMLMNIKGVKAVNLISIDGIPIDCILPEGSDAKTEMRYAAMTAAVVSLGERACRDTKKGNLNLVLIDGQEGKLLVVGCGTEFVISLSFDSTLSNEELFTEYFRTIDIVRNTVGVSLD